MTTHKKPTAITAAKIEVRRREQPRLDDDTLVGAYQSDLHLNQDCSAATVRTYGQHLEAFRRWITDQYPSTSLPDVQAAHVKTFLLGEAARGIAPTTRSTALFALRSFYQFLIAENLITVNPAADVTAPRFKANRVEFYSEAEADAIIAWAAAQPGMRWKVAAVILLTLRYTGLRLNELSNLRTEEVDLDARRISLVGKGGKDRIIPIPNVLADVLREYVDEMRPTLPASPYLFANPNGERNRKLYGRYGPRSIHDVVCQAGAAAGVSGRHFPHRWRHTYATSLVRRGEDIHVVQRLMGHSDIATTTR